MHLILILILLTSCSLAESTHNTEKLSIGKNNSSEISRSNINLKGWDHFYRLLVDNGVDADTALETILDKRMPKYTTVYFKLKPKESKSLYKNHNSLSKRKNARKFYDKHRDVFLAAAKRFNVNPEVMLSILQVETSCGGFTGRSRVFYRLARVSSLAQPKIIIENLKKIKKDQDPNAHYRDALARAKWLEASFLPHAIATIKLAESMNKHPLEIKGSFAGAIGFFQFLPGNVFTYGIDANNDGIVDPHNPVDAIHSIANYLKEHGWDNSQPLFSKTNKEAIWGYNRSESYIDTVLAMARDLRKEIRL